MEKSMNIQVPEGYEIDKEKSSFEKIVFKLKEKDKTKEMSDFLFNMLKETTARITGEKEITHYNKDGKWVIQQDYKNGYLWIRNSLIWKVFKEEYLLEYDEIRDFIQGWMEMNIGWMNLTPAYKESIAKRNVEMNTGFEILEI